VDGRSELVGSSEQYAARIDIVAAAGRAATDSPLMPVRHGGGSAVDDTLADLARVINREVLTMAAKTRRAADDLEDAFFFGGGTDPAASETNREDR
jgi:hypothetical protein